MNEIELIPNPTALIEATRSIGYSIETAIADLIDNSITAQATKIWIDFDATSNSPYVSITDDGIGMDFNTLKNAMKYGSTDPIFQRGGNDLGRFGLGLKTASMSQCRKLTVISKAGNATNSLCWDLDYIRNISRWSVIKLDDMTIQKLTSGSNIEKLNRGTMILWENLDRLSEGSSEKVGDILSKKMTDVRYHLSLVFHRFLDKKDSSAPNLEILMNNQTIEPFDPFLSPMSTKVMEEEKFQVNYEDENHNNQVAIVKCTPYILPFPAEMTPEVLEKHTIKESLKTSQGFYVYRNNRLIIWGTWFKLLKQHDAYKLARVKVDIPNTIDFLWSLDVKKSTANPPFVLRATLKKMIEYISKYSAHKYHFRGKIEEDPQTFHAWFREKTHSGIDYKINHDHPVLKDLEETLTDEQDSKLMLFLKNVENNIPLNSIFLDYSEDEKVNVVQDDKSSELKKLALTYIANSTTEIEIHQKIDLLRKMDLFLGKSDLLDKIETEAISCLEQ